MKTSIIRDVIQQANDRVFLPRSIHLQLLKDCPHTIPILVEWLYDEWSLYDTTLTKDRLQESFKNRAHDDQIPFTLVALQNDEPIGLITLKDKGEPEFDGLFGTAPWLGSFQVIPRERNKGLGQALLTVVKTIAERLGHQQILLYTSNPQNVEWHIKRGAHMIKQLPFRGHTISIMAIYLGRENTTTYHDLDKLAGTWSEKNKKKFDDNIKEFEKIDHDLWS